LRDSVYYHDQYWPAGSGQSKSARYGQYDRRIHREYALSSFFTYSAKDAKTQIQAGMAMCPLSALTLKIRDSGGMGRFLCSGDILPSIF
jgi:hypothetical protein